MAAFLCGWCIGEIEGAIEILKIAKEMENIATSTVIDINSPTIDGTVYLDGKAYRPDGPPYTINEFKTDIIKAHKEKNQK